MPTTLRIVLLICVFASTISILTGFDLTRNVLDPVTNTAVKGVVVVLRTTGLPQLVGFVSDTIGLSGAGSSSSSGAPSHDSEKLASLQGHSVSGKMRRQRNAVFVTAANGGGDSFSDADGDTNEAASSADTAATANLPRDGHQLIVKWLEPLLWETTVGVAETPSSSSSTAHSGSRGGGGASAATTATPTQTTTTIRWTPHGLPVLFNAYNYGSRVRFGHMLDTIVDVTTIWYRIVVYVSERVLGVVGLGGVGDGDVDDDEDEFDDDSPSSDSNNAPNWKVERKKRLPKAVRLAEEARIGKRRYFAAGDESDPVVTGYPSARGRASARRVRNWWGNGANRSSSQMAADGAIPAGNTDSSSVDVTKGASSHNTNDDADSYAANFASRADWEALDYALTKGNYLRQVVMLGGSGGSKPATNSATGTPSHTPTITRAVAQRIYIRPFKPSIDVFTVIGDAAVENDNSTMGSAEVIVVDVRGPLVGSATESDSQKHSSVFFANHSAFVAAVGAHVEHRRQTALLASTVNDGGTAAGKKGATTTSTNQQRAKSSSSPSSPADDNDPNEDWRARMRRQHEAQQRMKERAKAMKEGHTNNRRFADTLGTPMTKRKRVREVIDNEFVSVSGNITAHDYGIVGNGSGGISGPVVLTWGSNTVLPCFDQLLLALLKRSEMGLSGGASGLPQQKKGVAKGDESLSLHYVCPTATAFGRRGMRSLGIPPYAAVEVVIDGITVLSSPSTDEKV